MTARPARLTTTVASETSTITGMISDPGGYPLAGITVVLLEGGPEEDGVRLATTTTDDVGGYRFTRVRALPGDRFRLEARDESGGHVPTGDGFAIERGVTTHDLTMAVAGHIQGRVTTPHGSAPGRPATHVCVTAAGEDVAHAVNVSANGTFRIGGLPAGRYTLVFHDDVHLDAPVSASWMRVTVASGRTTTIDDQLFPRTPKN